MLKEIYKETEVRMKGAIQALEEDLAGIRTGRASPALIERLHVEYYGAPTPLIQLAIHQRARAALAADQAF